MVAKYYLKAMAGQNIFILSLKKRVTPMRVQVKSVEKAMSKIYRSPGMRQQMSGMYSSAMAPKENMLEDMDKHVTASLEDTTITSETITSSKKKSQAVTMCFLSTTTSLKSPILKQLTTTNQLL